MLVLPPLFACGVKRRKSLVEIPNNIVRRLGANGQANGRLRNALVGKLGVGQLRMSGSRGMDHQALYICHVCQQAKHLQVVDELPRSLFTALDLKGEDGSAAAREILGVERVIG